MLRSPTASRGLLRKLGNSTTSCASRSNSGSLPSPPPPSNNTGAAASTAVKYAKTTAGTGDPEGSGATGFSTRGPVTWPALGLVAIAAASAVSYYKIERERRLENAMGKIVSSYHLWNNLHYFSFCYSSSSFSIYQYLVMLARFQVSQDGVRILSCLRVGNT